MTPYQQAKAAHESDPFPFDCDIEEAIQEHIETEGGIVVSTPDCFVLARPVNTEADHILFDCPHVEFKNPDCWHIYLAAGDMLAIYNALPYPLPFVSYVRKNRLHFQSLKKIAEKANRFSRYGRTTETSQGARASEQDRS